MSKSIEDINEILDIAKKHNLTLNSTIFEKKPKELIELIDFCKQEKVEI